MTGLAALSQRLRMLATRGMVVQSALTALKTVLQITGLAGETQQNVTLLLPLGMSALPKGGDVVLLAIGGARSHLVALCADDSSLRIADLKAGEFGFRDYNGQQIVFRQDRLEVTTPLKLVGNVTGDCDLTVGGNVNLAVAGNVVLNASGNVTAQAAAFDLTGPVAIDGNVAVTGNVQASGNVQATGNVGGANVTASGTVTGATVTDGVRSMAADRAKYNSHGHGGVQAGSGTSGTPTVTE